MEVGNLHKRRIYASDRLYVLKIDLNLGESPDEPRIHALKLLSAELKRQIHPQKIFYTF